jgi:hypothetical protein
MKCAISYWPSTKIHKPDEVLVDKQTQTTYATQIFVPFINNILSKLTDKYSWELASGV